jgi:hypothetical protein
MKKLIIILFFSFTNHLVAQNMFTFIYVDNSISIDRALSLSNEVKSVINSTNKNGILVLANSPIQKENNSANYNKFNLDEDELLSNLNSILLKSTESQRPEEIEKIIFDELENSNVLIAVNNKSTQIKPLEIHFFFNASTFVRRKLDKKISDFLNVNYNIGKEEILNITFHLDYAKNKKQFDEYILESENNSSLKININKY